MASNYVIALVLFPIAIAYLLYFWDTFSKYLASEANMTDFKTIQYLKFDFRYQLLLFEFKWKMILYPQSLYRLAPEIENRIKSLRLVTFLCPLVVFGILYLYTLF